jgi:hypothetical protein
VNEVAHILMVEMHDWFMGQVDAVSEDRPGVCSALERNLVPAQTAREQQSKAQSQQGKADHRGGELVWWRTS